MLGKKGWGAIISPDVRIKKIRQWGGKWKTALKLKPGMLAEIEAHPQFRVPHLHIPDASTRSIIARHGVEIGFTQSGISELLITGKTPKNMLAMHMGDLPVSLRRGMRTHRVYNPSLLMPVRKYEVQQKRASGELVFGNDFKVRTDGLVEVHFRPVVYELDPTKVKSAEKVNWLAKSKKYEFMKNFRRVKKGIRVRGGQIVLTETQPVKIPKDMCLTIYSSTDGGSRHIHSLFIDPGFEGPIVLEIQGFKEGLKPDLLYARFMKLPDHLKE